MIVLSIQSSTSHLQIYPLCHSHLVFYEYHDEILVLEVLFLGAIIHISTSISSVASCFYNTRPWRTDQSKNEMQKYNVSNSGLSLIARISIMFEMLFKFDF